ncbi:MAG: hypothetical protein JWQ43_2718 [Glaciihabitans sp.]|nr:hypothetical protein [Glaciihabitans sp.]
MKLPSLIWVGLVSIALTGCVGQTGEISTSPAVPSAPPTSADGGSTTVPPMSTNPQPTSTSPAPTPAPTLTNPTPTNPAPTRESTPSSPAPAPASTDTPAVADPTGTILECDGTQLDISIAAQPTASGAGQFYSEITFTNSSDVTCFTEGPPSIFSLADSTTATPLGMLAENTGLAERVELAPGESAYSTAHFTNAGAYDCETAVADAAMVSPPNWDQSRIVLLESPITVCMTPATYSVSSLSASSLFR